MAIPKPLAALICHEHTHCPLPETILLLGRQTVLMSVTELEALAGHFGFDVPRVEVDDFTVSAKQNPDREFVTDESFFAMLGVRTIQALDVSDFENADLVHDICGELPDALEGQFDFIFNGSVFDNVFNPATAMRNVGKLLAPGGRVVHVETGSNNPYAYSILSPTWFFDYAVVNDWQDCIVYSGDVGDIDGLMYGPWGMMGFDVHAQDRPDAQMINFGGKLAVTVCIAEKGAASGWQAHPIQSHYRTDEMWAEFIAHAQPMMDSKRRFLRGEGAPERSEATLLSPWTSCGWWR